MTEKRVRILMAKLGNGFDTAMYRISKAFRDAGYEVIYTDAQTPAVIVQSAIQEDVDHIGITTLPEANIEKFGEIMELLVEENAADIMVTAGGFLDEGDIPRIKEMGICEFFPKGTTYKRLIEWSREHIKPI